MNLYMSFSGACLYWRAKLDFKLGSRRSSRSYFNHLLKLYYGCYPVKTFVLLEMNGTIVNIYAFRDLMKDGMYNVGKFRGILM